MHPNILLIKFGLSPYHHLQYTDVSTLIFCCWCDAEWNCGITMVSGEISGFYWNIQKKMHLIEKGIDGFVYCMSSSRHSPNAKTNSPIFSYFPPFQPWSKQNSISRHTLISIFAEFTHNIITHIVRIIIIINNSKHIPWQCVTRSSEFTSDTTFYADGIIEH